MLRGSKERQDRILAIMGAAALICALLVGSLTAADPFGGQSSDRISIAIDTPYVGQGVEVGTAVVVYGVEVGQVSDLLSLPGGGVRFTAELEKAPVAGLTDTMNIDFRPINYFGVPGINIIPGRGGHALRDGSEINLTPEGNFTLTELLSQLGDVSADALTPKLISLVDRTTRYTDGMFPLFEAMRIVATAVADVQVVSTAQLLSNTSNSAEAFPPFGDALVDLGTRAILYNYPEVSAMQAVATGENPGVPLMEGAMVPNLQDVPAEIFDTNYRRFLKVATDGLFGAIGKIEWSHVDDLQPLIRGMKAVTDTIPPLLRPEDIAQTLLELRSRFEQLYEGNGEQRALKVRLVLDSLPGVAASLGVVTAPPGTEGSAVGVPAPRSAELSPAGGALPPVDSGSEAGSSAPVEGQSHGVQTATDQRSPG